MVKQYTWEIAPCQAGFTLRERESGQLMHSSIGAWEEANRIYIAQSDLARRSLSGRTVIYDVGLGIATNALAALGASGTGAPAEIYSFERSPEALAQALSTPEKFPFFEPHLEKLRTLLNDGEWRSPDSRIRWKLITGDFREQDLSALPKADLVYYDFYAPAVCPELWTQAVFSKLFEKMNRESLLITYASNKAVRSAMLLAGFFVGDGATTPMKNETTVASPDYSILRHPLRSTWLSGLEKSAKPLPLDWSERQEEGLRLIREHPQFRD